ncbi:MAG: DUF5711 family protein [Anaerotignum sp.]
MEGNLSQFALNQNGYLSLLEKKDSGYEVKIYNSKGTLLKGRVEETAGVYPISTDVSDDNKSFAVSYVDTTDVYPIGRVLFLYANPEDSENYTDSLYASAASKADEIIGTIRCIAAMVFWRRFPIRAFMVSGTARKFGVII